MNNCRPPSTAPSHHHCFQTPGEGSKYAPRSDQAMPFVLLQLHPQPLLRITTKTGIWWKSSEMFSVTVKLPICLYNKYSQGSFTETLLFWSLPHQLEMTAQVLDVNSIISTQLWWGRLLSGIILCNASTDLGNLPSRLQNSPAHVIKRKNSPFWLQ